MGLPRFWNLGSGEDESLSRDSDDAFIGAAGGVSGKFYRSLLGYVTPDDGEVAILQFKNVGTATNRMGRRAIGVRVWSESAAENYLRCVHNLMRVDFTHIS